MEPSISEKNHRSRKKLWKKYDFRSMLIELQQDWMKKKNVETPPKQAAEAHNYLVKTQLLRFSKH